MMVRAGLLLFATCALGVPVAQGADSLSEAGSPSPADTFTIQQQFVTGVPLVTDFRFLPDGRLVLLTKGGTVYVRPASGGALVTAGSFSVDDTSEKGLLGLAVDPGFPTNRRLYFYYSAADAAGGTADDRHRVVVRTLGANHLLDAGETVLLQGLRGPGNHDGGALDIGPDGYLYVGAGDTGCNSGQPPGDTPSNFYATCLSGHPSTNGAANGKVLRIALDGTIPATNPLVGAGNVTACGDSCGDAIAPGVVGPPRTEVFAWGLRNPFRLWVDPQTGLVWTGDVGEVTWEEITILQPGRHHGWPWREGAHGWPVAKCRDVQVGTDGGGNPIQDGDCVEPIWECSHASGCNAITGGLIVDSCQWPDSFRGKYIFGDSSTGAVWTLTPNAARTGLARANEAPFARINSPVAFHTGPDGALYVASHYGNRIARIAPRSPRTCDPSADPCAGLSGANLARCAVDGALATPLCAKEQIEARVARIARARLRRARRLLGRAAHRTGTKAARLLAAADRALASILPPVQKSVGRERTTTDCGAAVAEVVERLRAAVAAAGPTS